MSAVVIGIGSPDGGDDAVGLLVAEQLQYAGPAGVVVVTTTSPTELLELWDAEHDVVIIDCVRGGDAPGTMTVRRLQSSPLPHREGARGTHGLGLADAVELARALDRLPHSLVLVGVEGLSFAQGASLSPEVAAAVDPATAAVLAALSQADSDPAPRAHQVPG